MKIKKKNYLNHIKQLNLMYMIQKKKSKENKINIGKLQQQHHHL